MVKVFFSYSHADEDLRDQLEKQLAMLKRQRLNEAWHDRRIAAGSEIDREISAQMEAAEIILLLVSPDFIASDYCYDLEMGRAMERHKHGDAKVIPVILRPCDWHHAPFGKLLAVPTDGKPITKWPDRDDAFLDVSKSIREEVAKFSEGQPIEYKSVTLSSAGPAGLIVKERSSNLRIKKQFSDRDKDKFRIDSFEYMARFFENSLQELEDRNQEIECAFRKIDGNRFTAAVYSNGKSVAKCTIFTGGERFLGQGISFVHGETDSSNGYNESLTVQADDMSMFLSSSGMAAMMRGGSDSERLSQEGASELYWGLLMQPLQNYS